MRRVSNHNIINKIRPTIVGLESEKPSHIPEGVTYLAYDTFRLYVGGMDHFIPFSVDGFPYGKLVLDYASRLCFRYYVDPVAGNDENDGQSWANAKKTLNAVYNELPQDLKGYYVWILIQGGTITGSVNVNFKNTTMVHKWCGTFINTNTDSISVFIRNGETNPIRNNDPIILKGDDDTVTPFKYDGENINLYFEANNPAWAHWQEGYCWYDKFIFEDPDTSTPNQHDYLLQAVTGQNKNNALNLMGVGLKAHGTKLFLVYSWAEYGGIAGIHVHDSGIGELWTSTDVWRAIFNLRGNHITNRIYLGMIAGGGYIKYDPLAAPPGWTVAEKMVIVVDKTVVSFFGNGGGASKSVLMDLDADDVVYNGTGSPKINLSTDFEGTIKYPSATLTLVDTSTAPRLIKDYATGIEKRYLTNNILQQGSNVVFSLPTSDPHIVGALWNNTGDVVISAG